jgi:hypothetical protein
MGDEVGSMLLRNAVAESSVFSHEKAVVSTPNGFQVKQLADVPPSRTGEAQSQTPGLLGRYNCPHRHRLVSQRITAQLLMLPNISRHLGTALAADQLAQSGSFRETYGKPI